MSLKPKRLTEQVATCEFTHHAHAHNIIQFWLIWGEADSSTNQLLLIVSTIYIQVWIDY